MKRFSSVVVTLLMSVVLFSPFMEDCSAKGRGSTRSSRSPTRSYSSPSRSTPSRTTPSRSTPSRSTTKTTSSGKSAAATKSYQKAKESGKAFKSVSAAKSDFKSKAKSDPAVKASLAKSYPTTYSKEPASRPAHIPQTYNNQTVVFQNGGYGYMGSGGWSPLTSYMLLDTMSDAMMMSAMTNSGYHVGPPPVVHSSGSGIIVTIMISLAVIVLLMVVISAASKMDN